jgi:molybdopterin converting factor small subunit
VIVEANTVNEARDYIEKNFGPIFRDKLKARGTNMVQSIWENSNILLNGKNISQLDNPVLKDGDKLDVISKVAGG